MNKKFILFFGIIFLIFIGLVIPFLIAGDSPTSISDSSSDNPQNLIILSGDNTNFNDLISYDKVHLGEHYGDTSPSYMESGSITFGEDSNADISKLLENNEQEVHLEVSGGKSSFFRGENSDVYILKYAGESKGKATVVNLNNNKFLLGEGDSIKIDKEGNVIGGKFRTLKDSAYNFSTFSFTSPSQGSVNFDLTSGYEDSLSLPKGSTLNDFDDARLKDIGGKITIKGENIVISHKLADELFKSGDFPKGFETFTGELQFIRGDKQPGEELKNPMYIAYIPMHSKVAFPNKHLAIEGGSNGISLVFGGISSSGTLGTGTTGIFNYDTGKRLVKGGNVVGHRFSMGNKNYGFNTYSQGDFISLGENDFYVHKNSQDRKEEDHKSKNTLFSFEEGSNYAGFHVDEGRSLSFNFNTFEGAFKKGEVHIADKTGMWWDVATGEDRLFLRNGKVKYENGEGYPGTSPVSLDVFSDRFGQISTINLKGVSIFAFTNKNVADKVRKSYIICNKKGESSCKLFQLPQKDLYGFDLDKILKEMETKRANPEN